jgi:hypothetical protein
MTLYRRLQFYLASRAKQREILTNLALIAGLLVCFGIVGRMDYEDALIAEAERQSANADLNRAALLACLNGGAPGLYTESADGVRVYLVCDPPYEVSDQNIRRRAS